MRITFCGTASSQLHPPRAATSILLEPLPGDDAGHLLTETLDHLLSPAYDAVSQMLGATSGGAVTTH